MIYVFIEYISYIYDNIYCNLFSIYCVWFLKFNILVSLIFYFLVVGVENGDGYISVLNLMVFLLLLKFVYVNIIY